VARSGCGRSSWACLPRRVLSRGTCSEGSVHWMRLWQRLREQGSVGRTRTASLRGQLSGSPADGRPDEASAALERAIEIGPRSISESWSTGRHHLARLCATRQARPTLVSCRARGRVFFEGYRDTRSARGQALLDTLR